MNFQKIVFNSINFLLSALRQLPKLCDYAILHTGLYIKRCKLNENFKQQLNNSNCPLLYFITDSSVTGRRRLLEIVEGGIKAGIDMIQVREKGLSDCDFFELTRSIVALAQNSNCKVLVNDRFDIAIAAKAQGVHLSSKSMPIHTIRRNIGSDMIVGYSSHSFEEIGKAGKDGADFATYSPVFKTGNTLKGNPKGVKDLAYVVKKSDLPVFALGGINLSNIATLSDTEVSGVALISAIADSSTVGYTVEQLKLSLSRFKNSRGMRQ